MANKVFLTGSFGNAGEQIIIQLIRQNFTVVCFDVKTELNVKKERKLALKHTFETIWGDLRECKGVGESIERINPDVIIHNAAIIPPAAYIHPRLAQDVNVGGTQNLIASAEKLATPPKFIFISSYSVHGPQNPHKKSDLLTGESPVNPGDNYGKQKIACERMLRVSALPWTIIRFPAVFGIDPNANQHPANMTFNFLLSVDRKEHAIDVRDAALAVVNAINADTVGNTFNIGGDKSWQKTAGELTEGLFKARGISPLPKSAYRQADPKVDDSWYYENWIDTEPSEKVLKYQKHSFKSYLTTLTENVGYKRHIFKIMSPLIQSKLLKESPFYGKDLKIDSRQFWEVLRETFDINEEK